jgi:competence ComEA-like helix-hairpin-helix protein
MQEVFPMKKVPILLSVAAAALLVFVIGFQHLRNRGSENVQISTLPYPAPTVTETTVAAETVSFPIDINTADVEALMQLPGIGETIARRIVDYRSTHGSFQSPSDLLNVEGIGQKRLDAILDYITIGGSNEDIGC